MFSLLQNPPSLLTERLMLQMLGIARALIYMDNSSMVEFDDNFEMLGKIQEESNPTSTRCCVCQLRQTCLAVATGVDATEILLDKSNAMLWQLMTKDEPPVKPAPGRSLLTWVQNKYDQLGCGVVVMVSHSNPAMSLAAFKLGTALLENGNTVVQDNMLATLLATSDDRFCATCDAMIRLSVSATVKRRELHQTLTDLKQQQMIDDLIALSNVAEGGSVVAQMRQHASFYELKFANITDNIRMTTAALRMMKLLGEGHHTGFQNFLREQTTSTNSYNLLDSCVELMAFVQPSITPSIAIGDKVIPDLYVHSCDFLIEMMLGPCKKNQQTLAASDLVMNINTLLLELQADAEREMTWNYEEEDMRCRIRTVTCGVLTAMLEGVSTTPVPRAIISKLEASVLVKQVLGAMHLIEKEEERMDKVGSISDINPQLIVELIQRQLQEAFNAYFLIVYLTFFDYGRDGEFVMELANFKKQHGHEEGVYAKLENESAMIEVLKDNLCYRILYPIPAHCLELRDNDVFIERTKQMISSIPRDNADEKAFTLLRNLKMMDRQMTHMNDILSHPRLWWLGKYRANLESMPYFMSLAIIFILFFFYGSKSEPWALIPSVEPCTMLLCIVHICFTCVTNMIYFIVIAPTSLRPVDHGVATDRENEERESEADLPLYARTLPPPPKWICHEPLYQVTLRYALGSIEAYYYVTTLVISILGAFHTNFFHAFLLLEFFRRPEGQLVIKACRMGAYKLMNSFIMGLTMILLWTCISWQFFQDEINKIQYCRTFYQCTFKAIQEGLRGDLGTKMHGDEHGSIRGDYKPPEVFYEDPGYQAQVLLVLFFYMLWEFILAGIIQGQIIDTFAEIRMRDDENLRDERETCMVCSMSRFALESASINFHEHIRKEHNPLSYLFFFNYIVAKDQDEYTGLESYVREALDQTSTCFIPINTCAAQNDAKNDANVITNAMLDSKLTGMNDSLTHMLDTLALLHNKIDTMNAES